MASEWKYAEPLRPRLRTGTLSLLLCSIGKASHRVSPSSRGGEKGPPVEERNCKVIWQRVCIQKGGEYCVRVL